MRGIVPSASRWLTLLLVAAVVAACAGPVPSSSATASMEPSVQPTTSPPTATPPAASPSATSGATQRPDKPSNNLGDLLADADRHLGSPVQVSARICGKAEGGPVITLADADGRCRVFVLPDTRLSAGQWRQWVEGHSVTVTGTFQELTAENVDRVGNPVLGGEDVVAFYDGFRYMILASRIEQRSQVWPPRPLLHVEGIARVIGEGVYLQDGPGAQSDPFRRFHRRPCLTHGPSPCRPIRLGDRRGTELIYVLFGPINVDERDWYQVASAGGTSGPVHVGWVAAADRQGPTLATVEPDCPSGQIELSDVTPSSIAWYDLLACFGDQRLEMTGYYPAPPPGVELSSTCHVPGNRPFCAFHQSQVLLPSEAPWALDATVLRWVGDSGDELQAPEPNTWITVRGRFSHSDSRKCGRLGTAGDLADTQCRLKFVVSEISPAGRSDRPS